MVGWACPPMMTMSRRSVVDIHYISLDALEWLGVGGGPQPKRLGLTSGQRFAPVDMKRLAGEKGVGHREQHPVRRCPGWCRSGAPVAALMSAK